MQALRASFRPEFLNRIDEIIVFRALSREQLAEITRLLLDQVRRRLRAQHIEVEFTDAAVEHLTEVGFDPKFGARPLRRAIQREVENELSRLVLAEALAPDDRVVVDVADGTLAFEVATATPSRPTTRRRRPPAPAGTRRSQPARTPPPPADDHPRTAVGVHQAVTTRSQPFSPPGTASGRHSP